MSSFGPAVLVRHPRHLSDLECVAGIDSFADVDEETYAGGWRLGYVSSPEYHDPVSLAGQLVAETGAPAIALYVNDGECANGASGSPQDNACEFFVDEQAFLGFCADSDEEDQVRLQLRRNDSAIDVLVRWAGEAGLTADREGLAAALAGPSDDAVHRFVEALGIGRG